MSAIWRPTIETVLQLSAGQVAGPPQHGRKGGGRNSMASRPAACACCEAKQDQTWMGSRVLDILLEGVSAWQYGAAVRSGDCEEGRHRGGLEFGASRAAVQSFEAQLEKLLNRATTTWTCSSSTSMECTSAISA